LAADAGITHNTARSWLTILEASYILFFLQPHHRNFNKRLTKSPKLYFHDVGLAAYLLGLRDPDQLALHPLRRALFENWVVSELLKHRLHRGLSSDLYFWRDRSGTEVDLVIEQETKLMPVEIKSGKTITTDQLKGLRTWMGIAGDAAADGWLVYGGDTKAVRSGIHIVPWAKTAGILG
jgi:predicted AAA+ superfamily ATPase